MTIADSLTSRDLSSIANNLDNIHYYLRIMQAMVIDSLCECVTNDKSATKKMYECISLLVGQISPKLVEMEKLNLQLREVHCKVCKTR